MSVYINMTKGRGGQQRVGWGHGGGLGQGEWGMRMCDGNGMGDMGLVQKRIMCWEGGMALTMLRLWL